MQHIDEATYRSKGNNDDAPNKRKKNTHTIEMTAKTTTGNRCQVCNDPHHALTPEIRVRLDYRGRGFQVCNDDAPSHCDGNTIMYFARNDKYL